MRGPLDVVRHLLGDDVPHEIVHLPRRIETARELPDVLGVPPDTCVAVDVLAVDSGHVATIVPCDSVVRPSMLARVMRSGTASHADVMDASRVTDFMATLVAPVGLPETLPVLADSRLASGEIVFAPTGDAATALKIRAVDLVRAAGAGLADFAEPLARAGRRAPVAVAGRVPALPLR